MLQKEKKHRPQSRIVRFFEYIVTPSGRRLSFYLTGAGALGLACANYLPHTVCSDFYRDFIQHYTYGFPTEVPNEVKQRIDRAADRLEINESTRKLVKPFTVTGFNTIGIGSLNTIYGAWIGVPSNFYYKSVADIDRANIHIRHESVKWGSDHGKLLEESLILTDAEQVFDFCRVLMDLQGYKLYLNTIAPSGVWLAVYLAAQQINQTQNLYGRPALARYVIYSLLATFGYGIYSFIIDFMNFQRQLQIDEKVADLGKDMVEAGVGFYTKQLNRNIAIREISGMDLYSVKGNENYFLRIKAVPLTARQAYFKDRLEQLNNPTDESDNQEETKKSTADQEKK